VWYSPAVPAQGWKPPISRKSSIADAGDLPPPGGGSKPNSGRVIRIINNQDHTVQVQSFANAYFVAHLCDGVTHRVDFSVLKRLIINIKYYILLS